MSALVALIGAVGGFLVGDAQLAPLVGTLAVYSVPVVLGVCVVGWFEREQRA